MIAQIVHRLEDIFLVEVGIGIEGDFHTGMAKNVAHSSDWGEDANENRGTNVSQHMYISVSNAHGFGSRGEVALSEELGIQWLPFCPDKDIVFRRESRANSLQVSPNSSGDGD